MSRGPRFSFQYAHKTCTCRICNNPFPSITGRAQICPDAKCQAQAKAEQDRKRKSRTPV